jgi:hypothetical protein
MGGRHWRKREFYRVATPNCSALSAIFRCMMNAGMGHAEMGNSMTQAPACP